MSAQARAENERLVRAGEEAIRQAGRNLLISFRESVCRELTSPCEQQRWSRRISPDEFAAATRPRAWRAGPPARTPGSSSVLLNGEDLEKLEEHAAGRS